uniref:Uncharacterized protein n=1 Tax=Bicosoecida sp. CB-2014 TaxID=1486930 RepID=A0A7S1C9K9_9STRA|mmetsp:Transcript_16193/g.56538  ORF Transcript_16193/g.56538 Transcript_16193/m.56538 type:complete len:1040 (+) Transcript_16193:186-3305(+)
MASAAPPPRAGLGEQLFDVLARDDLSGVRLRRALEAPMVEAVAEAEQRRRNARDVDDSDDEGLGDAVRWRAPLDAPHPATPGGTLVHAAVNQGKLSAVAWLAAAMPSLALQRDAGDRTPAELAEVEGSKPGRSARGRAAARALDAVVSLRRLRLPVDRVGGVAGTAGGAGRGDAGGRKEPGSVGAAAAPAAAVAGLPEREPAPAAGEIEELKAAAATETSGAVDRRVGVRLYNLALAAEEDGRLLSAGELLEAADAAMARAHDGAFAPAERVAPLNRLAALMRKRSRPKDAADAQDRATAVFDDARQRAGASAGFGDVGGDKPKEATAGVLGIVASPIPPPPPPSTATAEEVEAAIASVEAMAHEQAWTVEAEAAVRGGDGSPWAGWAHEPPADDVPAVDARVAHLPLLAYFAAGTGGADETPVVPAVSLSAAATKDQYEALRRAVEGWTWSEVAAVNAVSGISRCVARRWAALRRRADGSGFVARHWHHAPTGPPAWLAFNTGLFTPAARRMLCVLHDARRSLEEPQPLWQLHGFVVEGSDAVIGARASARDGDPEHPSASLSLIDAPGLRLACAFDDWRHGGPATLPTAKQLRVAASRAAAAAAKPDGKWHTMKISGKKDRARRVFSDACRYLLGTELRIGDSAEKPEGKHLREAFGDGGPQLVFEAAVDAIENAADVAEESGEHVAVAWFPLFVKPSPGDGAGGGGGAASAAAAGGVTAGGAAGGAGAAQAGAAAATTPADEEPSRLTRQFVIELLLPLPESVTAVGAGAVPGDAGVVRCALLVDLVEYDDDDGGGAELLPLSVFSLSGARSKVVAGTPPAAMPTWLLPGGVRPSAPPPDVAVAFTDCALGRCKGGVSVGVAAVWDFVDGLWDAMGRQWLAITDGAADGVGAAAHDLRERLPLVTDIMAAHPAAADSVRSLLLAAIVATKDDGGGADAAGGVAGGGETGSSSSGGGGEGGVGGDDGGDEGRVPPAAVAAVSEVMMALAVACARRKAAVREAAVAAELRDRPTPGSASEAKGRGAGSTDEHASVRVS